MDSNTITKWQKVFIKKMFSVVLSVIMLIVLGIKYMLGSVDEKANYKETLLPAHPCLSPGEPVWQEAILSPPDFFLSDPSGKHRILLSL